MSAATAKRAGLDKEEVRQACSGRWLDVLASVGIPRDVLDGQHHPCPKSACGGVDRFRLIDADAGAVLCNQCGSDIGDGFRTIQWWTGCTFPDAVAKAAEAVSFSSGGSSRLEPAKPSQPTRPEQSANLDFESGYT